MERVFSTSELDEVRTTFSKLRAQYQIALPKVDPALLNDFLSREKATNQPLSYTVEVFTKEGIDSEKAKEYIYQKTGMMPAVFDHGTHYVTNQILTLEMLKEISDSDDVLEVHGSYCGGIGMRGAYYEKNR
jgi:hypothetical protein